MEPQLAIPWYRSSIVVGIAVSLVCKLLVVSGLVANVAPEDVEAMSQVLVSFVGGAGDLWALVGRLKQTTPAKVVGTKTAAEAHVERQQPVQQERSQGLSVEDLYPAALEVADDLKLEVPSWMLRI